MIRISEQLIRQVRSIPFESDEKSSEPAFLQSLLSTSPDMQDSKIPGLKPMVLTRGPPGPPPLPATLTTPAAAAAKPSASTPPPPPPPLDDDDLTERDQGNGTTGAAGAAGAAGAGAGAGAAATEGKMPVAPAPIPITAAQAEEKKRLAEQRAKEKEKEKQTRVVKFTPIEEGGGMMTAESPFVKESVVRKTIASSLSKELSETGVLHRAARTMPTRGAGGSSRPAHGSKPSLILTGHIIPAGPLVGLKAYVTVGKKPLELKIPQVCSVQHVIECIIQAHKAIARQPAMRENSEFYELRVLDDDDGTPDMDMQPLDRARDFRRYDVSAVAVCENPNFTGDPNRGSGYGGAGGATAGGPGAGAGAGARGVMGALAAVGRLPSPSISGGPPGTEQKTSDKKFLKVYMDEHESHVIHVPRDNILEDLLAILGKKKHLEAADMMIAREYNFFPYVEGSSATGASMDMKQKISELKVEELRLVKKGQPTPTSPGGTGAGAGGAGAGTTGAAGATGELAEIPLSSFLFTKESAGTYCEYKVIKTNDRGRRQERILGIDAKTIWNKHDKKSAGRRISFDVSHDQRPVSTITSCTVVKDRPQLLEINFQDLAKKKVVSRQYETETRMECAEIVAKINFLMGLHTSSVRSGAGASSAVAYPLS